VTIIAGSPVRLDWSGRKAETWTWLPADEIEPETLQQIRDIGSLDVAVRAAVMPDAHKGYGMPIGCMLATRGAVVPYAVGVDIGCGMVAARTTLGLADLTLERIRAALAGIYKRVPVGQPTRQDPKQGSFETRQDSVAIREWWNDGGKDDAVLRTTRERADRQVGTLGGGNHFVELQVDLEGAMWLMLHTGSCAIAGMRRLSLVARRRGSLFPTGSSRISTFAPRPARRTCATCDTRCVTRKNRARESTRAASRRFERRSALSR